MGIVTAGIAILAACLLNDDAASLDRAIALQQRGRFQEARQLFIDRQSATVKRFGANSAEAAEGLLYLSAIHFSLQELTAAEHAARRALSLFESLQGPESRQAASALASLAAVLAQQGQMARATPVMRRAVFLLQRASAGNDDDLLQWAQENLAIIYQRQGDYPEARSLLERVLMEHPHEPNAEAALAEVAIGQGNWDQAASLAASARRTIEHFPGTDHPAMAGVLRIQATIQRHTGDLQGALDDLSRAIQILESAFGSTTAIEKEFLRDQQTVLRSLRRRSEARAVGRRLRSIIITQ